MLVLLPFCTFTILCSDIWTTFNLYSFVLLPIMLLSFQQFHTSLYTESSFHCAENLADALSFNCCFQTHHICLFLLLLALLFLMSHQLFLTGCHATTRALLNALLGVDALANSCCLQPPDSARDRMIK